MVNEKTVTRLELSAVKARKHIIEMLYLARSGHPGGSLSAVDAITALYFEYMKHDPKDPSRPRDIYRHQARQHTKRYQSWL